MSYVRSAIDILQVSTGVLSLFSNLSATAVVGITAWFVCLLRPPKDNIQFNSHSQATSASTARRFHRRWFNESD